MHLTFFKKILPIVAGIFCTTILAAQPAPVQPDEFLPKDYLTSSFHAGRRAAIRELMPENSVMVVFAYPTRNFSNDVEYLYLQNFPAFSSSAVRNPPIRAPFVFTSL